MIKKGKLHGVKKHKPHAAPKTVSGNSSLKHMWKVAPLTDEELESMLEAQEQVFNAEKQKSTPTKLSKRRKHSDFTKTEVSLLLKREDETFSPEHEDAVVERLGANRVRMVRSETDALDIFT